MISKLWKLPDQELASDSFKKFYLSELCDAHSKTNMSNRLPSSPTIKTFLRPTAISTPTQLLKGGRGSSVVLCAKNHNSCLLQQINTTFIPQESLSIPLSNGTNILALAIIEPTGWPWLPKYTYAHLQLAALPPMVLQSYYLCND